MALYKIFRDNQFWKDRVSPVPILGGIDRAVLSSGYTISSCIYYCFDTHIAYCISHGLAIFLSGIGFFFLGHELKEIINTNIDENLFCILGVIYISLGQWPVSILMFSFVPWWFFLIALVYRKRLIWPSFFFLLLMFNISGPLMGVFLVFYAALLIFIIFVSEKRIEKSIVWMSVIVAGGFIFFNRALIFKSNVTNIKSLATTNGTLYSDTIRDCLGKLKDILFFERGGIYHTGFSTLRYVAIPIIFFAFIFFIILYVREKITKKFMLIFSFAFLAVIVNMIAMAFDNCYILRKYVPFLSGFSFSRFMWLSPFFALVAFALTVSWINGIKYYLFNSVIICGLVVSIMFDIDYSVTTSMYNVLHVNLVKYMYDESLYKNIYARWDEYYAMELFSQIKNDINYSDEWSVGYGLEPAVLQYNGICTLDGYYSNYPIDYKERWEHMISPILADNAEAKEYWNISNGQRAYIYSEYWMFPDYGRNYQIYGDVDMNVNINILRDLKCKYIFSRVPIKNARELEIELIKKYESIETEYIIYVYGV